MTPYIPQIVSDVVIKTAVFQFKSGRDFFCGNLNMIGTACAIREMRACTVAKHSELIK